MNRPKSRSNAVDPVRDPTLPSAHQISLAEKERKMHTMFATRILNVAMATGDMSLVNESRVSNNVESYAYMYRMDHKTEIRLSGNNNGRLRLVLGRVSDA